MTETAVAVESRPQPMTAGFAPKERQALNPNQQVAFAMINIVTFLVGLAVLAVLDPRDQRFLLTALAVAAVLAVVNLMKWRIKANAADHLRYPAGKLADQ
ncbi:hypothetical protein [Nocardia seriolae]|uniref:Uncharacterized protein n=1 Tax=Nocardia seriolae TaxID=37332 RepID=A0A0B8NIU1_9NOCA|nr:hypothetical protein [Nocardia seriolae]APA97126.1 hypothetical protein NS506_03070 [Nocardia seriolae]MTJ65089.1 hypothetical protein [Nocardia seriolae]MTJ74866.1 hypothetical protein [Nocardia seriolae]MTJ86986.1 hypothetical protein [Nocardia seriolae]MTK30982.1 hypothetical protein [Nocardia seriolae]